MRKYALTLSVAVLVMAVMACNLPVNRVEEMTAPSLGATQTPLQSGADTAVYSDNGVQITLSNAFVLGDPEMDLAAAAEGGFADLYTQNVDNILLWANRVDPPTYLMVMENEEYAAMPLGIISTFAGSILGDAIGIAAQEQVQLGGREVLRLLTTTDTGGVEMTHAVYLFNENDKLWIIGFFTNQAQIDARLPAFDAAIASFTIVSID
ncbi:MAG: hypothetical protein SVR81_05570 [Chloroflexota bacterium]|nr:hypothetical protein [Chloroflexota bacterium]